MQKPLTAVLGILLEEKSSIMTDVKYLIKIKAIVRIIDSCWSLILFYS